MSGISTSTKPSTPVKWTKKELCESKPGRRWFYDESSNKGYCRPYWNPSTAYKKGNLPSLNPDITNEAQCKELGDLYTWVPDRKTGRGICKGRKYMNQIAPQIDGEMYLLAKEEGCVYHPIPRPYLRCLLEANQEWDDETKQCKPVKRVGAGGVNIHLYELYDRLKEQGYITCPSSTSYITDESPSASEEETDTDEESEAATEESNVNDINEQGEASAEDIEYQQEGQVSDYPIEAQELEYGVDNPMEGGEEDIEEYPMEGQEYPVEGQISERQTEFRNYAQPIYQQEVPYEPVEESLMYTRLRKRKPLGSPQSPINERAIQQSTRTTRRQKQKLPSPIRPLQSTAFLPLEQPMTTTTDEQMLYGDRWNVSLDQIRLQDNDWCSITKSSVQQGTAWLEIGNIFFKLFDPLTQSYYYLIELLFHPTQTVPKNNYPCLIWMPEIGVTQSEEIIQETDVQNANNVTILRDFVPYFKIPRNTLDVETITSYKNQAERKAITEWKKQICEKDTFHPSAIWLEDKAYANYNFAEAVFDMFYNPSNPTDLTRRRDRVLILDGGLLLTSKYLIDIGLYRADQIDIPNRCATWQMIQTVQNTPILQGIHLTRQSVFSNLLLSNRVYPAIWLDYCGAFETIKDDIRLFFRKKMLQIHPDKGYGVFAITAAHRAEKLPKNDTERNKIWKLTIKRILEIAEQYGYVTSRDHPYVLSYTSVYFIIFWFTSYHYLDTVERTRRRSLVGQNAIPRLPRLKEIVPIAHPDEYKKIQQQRSDESRNKGQLIHSNMPIQSAPRTSQILLPLPTSQRSTRSRI